MFDHLRFIYRDPAEGESGGAQPAPGESAEALALAEAILEDGGNGDAKPKDDKPAGGEKANDKTPGAGGEGKGKGAAAAAGEDPEVEIDSKDDKDQPVKLKVKMSELKSGYLRQDDYTKKTQRLSEIEKNQKDLITTVEAIRQNPKLAKLFVGLVEGAIGKDKDGKGFYNEEFIDKQLTALQGVQAAADDSKKDLKEKNEDIEDLLKDVDPESPIAKALRTTAANNKKIMADMKLLQESTGKASKAIEERATKEQEAQYQGLVEEAGKMMNNYLDEMTDAAKGGLDFFTDGEKMEWRYKVVAFLRDNPVEYKDDKEFVARIDQVGKAVHNYMVKFREGIIARQLEGPKLKQKEEPKKETQSTESQTLEEALEEELLALDQANAPAK